MCKIIRKIRQAACHLSKWKDVYIYCLRARHVFASFRAQLDSDLGVGKHKEPVGTPGQQAETILPPHISVPAF